MGDALAPKQASPLSKRNEGNESKIRLCLIWIFGHAWTVVLFIWFWSRIAGRPLRILKQPEMARIHCWRARTWTGRDFDNPSRGNTIWGIHDYRHSILMLFCHVISISKGCRPCRRPRNKQPRLADLSGRADSDYPSVSFHFPAVFHQCSNDSMIYWILHPLGPAQCLLHAAIAKLQTSAPKLSPHPSPPKNTT